MTKSFTELSAAEQMEIDGGMFSWPALPIIVTTWIAGKIYGLFH